MEKKGKEEQEEKENTPQKETVLPEPAPPPDAKLSDPVPLGQYLAGAVRKNLAEPLAGAGKEFADGFQGKSEETTIPSILGNTAGGFVVDGALKTAKDLAEVITHPVETAEGLAAAVGSAVSNPAGTAAGVGDAVDKYLQDNWIHANMNERARASGSLAFEVVLTAATSGAGKGVETGARGTTAIVKEGLGEAAKTSLKKTARKEGGELLEKAAKAGTGEIVKETVKEAAKESLESLAENVIGQIMEQQSGQTEKNGKVKININEPTYLEKIDAIVALMEKDGVPKDSEFEILYNKYGQKGGQYKYKREEIVAAYYKYTGKMDDNYLNEINYQRILKDDGRPVIQNNDPEREVRNHAHHICYKSGKGRKQKEWVKQGHGILRKYGIDPVLDPHNLVPAPNTGHSAEEIEKVVKDLEKAEAKAIEKCEESGKKGKDRDSYIREQLYKSLGKSGKRAQKKDPTKKVKKGKKKDGKKS